MLVKDYSIGICAYNEEKNIKKLLDFILSEKLKNLKKVIIVAEGKDKTYDICSSFIKKNNGFLLLKGKGNGKSFAMNQIIKNASGEYIIFISGDNIPKKGSIKKLLSKHKEEVSAIVGRSKPKNKNKIEEVLWELHHEASKVIPKLSDFYAARKKYLKKIPKEIINDDSFLVSLLKKRGKIIYNPSAMTKMMHKWDFSEYMRRRRRIAIGFIQSIKRGYGGGHIPLILKFKLLLRFIKTKYFGSLLVFVLLEIIANIMAHIDYSMGFIPHNWRKKWK